MRNAVISVLLIYGATGFVRAQMLGDADKCSRMIDALQAKDLTEIALLNSFIRTTAFDVDRKHALAGEKAPLRRLTDRSAAGLVASAARYCQQYPDASIAYSALWAYNAFRVGETSVSAKYSLPEPRRM